jgi:hypothetical protein
MTKFSPIFSRRPTFHKQFIQKNTLFNSISNHTHTRAQQQAALYTNQTQLLSAPAGNRNECAACNHASKRTVLHRTVKICAVRKQAL